MGGALKKHETFEPERLKQWTARTLNDTDKETFENIDASDGLLNKYLSAIMLTVSGTAKQSAATAALPKETIHGIISQLTLKSNGWTFFNKLPGNAFVMLCEMDGIYQAGNAAGTPPSADFANDVNDHTFDITYVFPLSYGWLREQEHRPAEGSHDLALFDDKGWLEWRTISTLGGDWSLKAGTTLTITADLITFKSPFLLLPRPNKFETWSDSKDPSHSSVLAGKVDLALSCHNTYDALTRPASAFDLRLDGETIQRGMTGAELVRVLEMGRDDEFGRFANAYQPLIVRNIKDTEHYRYGAKLTLDGVNTTGSAMRHYIRRLCDCSGELLTKWATARGITITKDSAGRFLIDGKPVNMDRNGRLTPDIKAGLQRSYT